MTRRKQITISYRVFDDSNRTIEVFRLTGFNRQQLTWLANRRVASKYGKGRFKIHPYKVVETD